MRHVAGAGRVCGQAHDLPSEAVRIGHADVLADTESFADVLADAEHEPDADPDDVSLANDVTESFTGAVVFHRIRGRQPPGPR